MHDDILRLWKDNGSLWLTQYLSEVCRIIVSWVGGTPYVQPTKGVRVRRTRYGLPVLLPGPLRNIFLLLKGEDHAYALKVIRVSLTVLSVYRVIGCSPNLRLELLRIHSEVRGRRFPSGKWLKPWGCCLKHW